MMHLGESFDLLPRVLRRQSQLRHQEGAIPERSLLEHICSWVVDLSNFVFVTAHKGAHDLRKCHRKKS